MAIVDVGLLWDQDKNKKRPEQEMANAEKIDRPLRKRIPRGDCLQREIPESNKGTEMINGSLQCSQGDLARMDLYTQYYTITFAVPGRCVQQGTGKYGSQMRGVKRMVKVE